MIAVAGSAFDARRECPQGTERGPGMGGMEFTWRMIATLAWPAVVIVTVFVFRKWITERLESLGITLGVADRASEGSEQQGQRCWGEHIDNAVRQHASAAERRNS